MTVKTVFATNTARAKVRIEQDRQRLQLKFDSDQQAIQSAIDIERPHRLLMENLIYLMGILLFIPVPRNILLLGVGGGALVHFFRHYLPGSSITAVDYDAELLQIASEQMKLPPADAALEYVVQDARAFIQHCPRDYDLIVVDIFDAGLTPAWLLQQPFNQQLKLCLSKRGALAYNLLLLSDQRFNRFQQMLDALYRQQTLYLEMDDFENHLAYAVNFRSASRQLQRQLEHCADLQQQYELPLCQVMKLIYDSNPQGAGII